MYLCYMKIKSLLEVHLIHLFLKFLKNPMNQKSGEVSKEEDLRPRMQTGTRKSMQLTEEEAKVVKQQSPEPKGKIRTIKGLPDGTTGGQIRAAAARKLGMQ